jgi:hypothetical protein
VTRTLTILLAAAALGTAGCTDDPTRPAAPDAAARLGVAPAPANISYQAHSQDHGWLPWVSNGQVAGTVGQARRLEALRIDLSGSSSPAAKVCYQAHVQDHGWMAPVCGNGQMAGTTDQARRMEAVKIWVEDAPDLAICYRAHVANIGWQDEVCNGQVAGTVGAALQMEAITIQLRKPFYAWTEWHTGAPNNIRLQGSAGWTGQHESYDRQHVWAGNCEKYYQLDRGFVDRNRGKYRIYFIGDEPDHHQANCLYTPAEYAKLFHDAVTEIRSIDPTARFSNGGFAQPDAPPAGVPHFTDYADAFIAAYRALTGGQDPPIAEWRFHSIGADAATANAWITQAANWAGARGQKVFMGSIMASAGDMQAIIEHIENDSRVVGAAWWSYDYVSRGGEVWGSSLTNQNGTLNARGELYATLIK